MPEDTIQQEAKPEQPSQGLTLQDLVMVAQIIQVGASKGIFRAEDMLQIGSLYTRLISFLESTGAIARNQPATNEPAPQEPAPEVASTKAKAKETKNVKARR